MEGFTEKRAKKEGGALPGPEMQLGRRREDGPVRMKLSSETLQYAVKRLREIQSDPDRYVGEGGAAIVHRVGSGICVKIFRTHHESPHQKLMKKGNTADQEARFLQRLSKLERQGVRTPRYVSHTKEEGMSAIVMEELNAVNLKEVLDGRAPCPPAFNYQQFFAALEAYREALNDEAEILHGDLEARNIMIDLKTGMPYVIDFGQAKDLRTLKPEERRRVERKDYETLNVIEEEAAEKKLGVANIDSTNN